MVHDNIVTHPHTVFVFAAIGKFSELGDGKFVYEIEGLPVGDPDDEFYPNAKPPSRVTFSTGPMQVAPAAYNVYLASINVVLCRLFHGYSILFPIE